MAQEVSISAQYVAVGSRLDGELGQYAGAAYVFDASVQLQNADSDQDGLPDAWEIEFGLHPLDDGTIDPNNGPAADPDGDGYSNVEEFLAGTHPWVADLLANVKLTASDGVAGDIFGIATSMDGNFLGVGSVGHDPSGPDSGAAYVFQRNGAAWDEVAQLIPSYL